MSASSPKARTMNWILVEEEHRRGSTDPYVARTIIQAGDLSRVFNLGKEKEQGIVGVFNQYRRHLHQCDEISQRITAQIAEHSETLSNSPDARNGTVVRLPSVSNLTNDIETFLYHAKLAFRELKDLFQFTQNKRFKLATRYEHIAEWSEKNW